MKKKYWLLLILAILFYVPNTYAFDSNNYRYKGLCGTFEVTSLKRNGSIEAKGCYGSYNEAKNYMTSIGTEDLVIMTKVNGETAIIDANYALLDLTVNVPSPSINKSSLEYIAASNVSVVVLVILLSSSNSL